jgi:hypothetical protein
VNSSSYEQRLEMMLADKSEAVRAVAAYHVAELGLRSLSPAFATGATQGSRLSRESFSRAKEMLENVSRSPARSTS